MTTKPSAWVGPVNYDVSTATLQYSRCLIGDREVAFNIGDVVLFYKNPPSAIRNSQPSSPTTTTTTTTLIATAAGVLHSSSTATAITGGAQNNNFIFVGRLRSLRHNPRATCERKATVSLFTSLANMHAYDHFSRFLLEIAELPNNISYNNNNNNNNNNEQQQQQPEVLQSVIEIPLEQICGRAEIRDVSSEVGPCATCFLSSTPALDHENFEDFTQRKVVGENENVVGGKQNTPNSASESFSSGGGKKNKNNNNQLQQNSVSFSQNLSSSSGGQKNQQQSNNNMNRDESPVFITDVQLRDLVNQYNVKVKEVSLSSSTSSSASNSAISQLKKLRKQIENRLRLVTTQIFLSKKTCTGCSSAKSSSLNSLLSSGSSSSQQEQEEEENTVSSHVATALHRVLLRLPPSAASLLDLACSHRSQTNSQQQTQTQDQKQQQNNTSSRVKKEQQEQEDNQDEEETQYEDEEEEQTQYEQNQSQKLPRASQVKAKGEAHRRYREEDNIEQNFEFPLQKSGEGENESGNPNNNNNNEEQQSSSSTSAAAAALTGQQTSEQQQQQQQQLKKVFSHSSLAAAGISLDFLRQKKQ